MSQNESTASSSFGSPSRKTSNANSGKGLLRRMSNMAGAVGSENAKSSNNLVAIWEVALADDVHSIEFRHGTTTGKRVLLVDGQQVLRREWMFKLVGSEEFTIGKQKIPASVHIDACSGFSYEYTLKVDGKSYKKFMENQNMVTTAWTCAIDGKDTRIVLQKDTMEVWVNGDKVETAGEFGDEGTETHFEVDNHGCFIRALSSGNRKEGIRHTLYIDDQLVPDSHF